MKERIYTQEYHESIGSPAYLEKFIGTEYISYSYITSYFRDRRDWITTYLLDVRAQSIFAEYGNAVGTYLQTSGEEAHDLLTNDTKKLLDNYLYDSSHEFEKPIGFMLGKYLFIGFIDVYKEDVLIDIKTASDKTVKQYYDSTYKQTKLYTYALSKMGLKIPEYIGVIAFMRKGNNTYKHPLRIEGEPVIIDYEYNEEEIETWLQEDILTALEEIEDYKRLFKGLYEIG